MVPSEGFSPDLAPHYLVVPELYPLILKKWSSGEDMVLANNRTQGGRCGKLLPIANQSEAQLIPGPVTDV